MCDGGVAQLQKFKRIRQRDALKLLMFVPLRCKDRRYWGREMPSKLLMFVSLRFKSRRDWGRDAFQAADVCVTQAQGWRDWSREMPSSC